MALEIPANYWSGQHCIPMRLPWLVPGAIRALDAILTPEDSVLELGSGGSTLFFADRCMRVVTFELDPTWAKIVQAALAPSARGNVDYRLLAKPADAERILRQDYAGSRFNIVVPDWTANREILVPLLGSIIDPARFSLVLDNYAAANLYPTRTAHDYIDGLAVPTYCRVFDDPHWWGKGTKIYTTVPIPPAEEEVK